MELNENVGEQVCEGEGAGPEQVYRCGIGLMWSKTTLTHLYTSIPHLPTPEC